jgi:hypothetical protein
MDKFVVPFAARHRTPLPPTETPARAHRYDPIQQVWVCATSGEALVVHYMKHRSHPLDASEFGETILTRTSEGADQSEGRAEKRALTPRPTGLRSFTTAARDLLARE